MLIPMMLDNACAEKNDVRNKYKDGNGGFLVKLRPSIV